MKILLLPPILYLAAVAETSLADALRVGSVAPEVLALVAVVWLLVAAGRYGFLTAGAIMLVGDLCAPGRVGVGAAWMLLVGYAICRLRLRARLSHYLFQLPVVFAAVAAWAACVGLSERFAGDIGLPLGTILTRSLGVGLYTAGLALPILMLLAWFREPRGARLLERPVQKMSNSCS
jgi:hypothetical protein